MRTGLYFALIALSLAALVAAVGLGRQLTARWGGWNAVLVAATAYLAAMTLAAMLLPSVNEVPDGFPAVVLWQFRLASLGAQAILWTTLGLGFGVFAAQLTEVGGSAACPATDGR